MKRNITAPVWTWVTVPPAFLILLLGLSLVGPDRRLTLLVATICMLGVLPVLLFHTYRRDIAERQRTEGERDRLLIQLEGTTRVLETIPTDASLSEVLTVVARVVEEQTGSSCSIQLLDDQGTRLLHGAAPSLPESYNQAIHGITIGPPVGSCGTAG